MEYKKIIIFVMEKSCLDYFLFCINGYFNGYFVYLIFFYMMMVCYLVN